MQIAADGFFHLTYCTNIHPGERWPEVRTNLERYLPALKARLAPDQPFGIGLRLSDAAARDLLAKDALPRFRNWLADSGLYVFTINGFPYGGFHGQVVKDQVYVPDWRSPERLNYTIRLSRILAALVPEGLDGGISTVPLSYKPWFRDIAERNSVLDQSTHHLALICADLAGIREEKGRFLHLDLEPEPDCLLENADDVLNYCHDWLLPIGAPLLAQSLGIGRGAAEDRLLDHIRLCYDTCHFAVEYEKPESFLASFRAEGIQVGKVQISAALRLRLPDDQAGRSTLSEELRPFAESTYLHQTVEHRADGSLRRYPDLGAALPWITDPAAREWRIHFHVPIFIESYGRLQSTQPDIIAALGLLSDLPSCRHLEIETYTWDVLPAAMKADLPASIQREYMWVLSQFTPSNPEPTIAPTAATAVVDS